MNDDYSRMLRRMGKKERLSWMAFDVGKGTVRPAPVRRSHAFWLLAQRVHDLLDPDLDWEEWKRANAETLHRLQS